MPSFENLPSNNGSNPDYKSDDADDVHRYTFDKPVFCFCGYYFLYAKGEMSTTTSFLRAPNKMPLALLQLLVVQDVLSASLRLASGILLGALKHYSRSGLQNGCLGAVTRPRERVVFPLNENEFSQTGSPAIMEHIQVLGRPVTLRLHLSMDLPCFS